MQNFTLSSVVRMGKCLPSGMNGPTCNLRLTNILLEGALDLTCFLFPWHVGFTVFKTSLLASTCCLGNLDGLIEQRPQLGKLPCESFGLITRSAIDFGSRRLLYHDIIHNVLRSVSQEFGCLSPLVTVNVM